jgi:UDP-N-acetylglucosamine diphosphorylase / glucose-1-phosphate thymidylyltransferase / UDP-N-acetylgalactosamine diphosphorylase / glucosamine-1-phosphate N-acetyltransferase / galactosamine-1-phosphate N-acetyltransferase
MKDMKLQAIVLAGGIGKRIAPLGLTKPKSMFKIMGKPIVFHVLNAIRTSGLIEDVTVIIGPGDSAIRDYLEQGELTGLNLHFAVQEQPLGQANALLQARPTAPGPFLVLNANDIFDPALLVELAQLGMEKSLDVGLVGRVVDEPSKFGVMAFDTQGRLTGVVEKPRPEAAPSNVAVVGLYYFSAQIWAALDATPLAATDDQLERAYQKLISNGNGDYLKYDGPFATYKYPWDLLAINDLMLNQIGASTIAGSARISPLAVLDGKVIIEEGARVMENAIIRGPAYIGKNSIVGNHTLLRGNTTLGQQCVVGFGTEISHSILADNCWTHKNFIGDSIIADNCSFGAGTITANLRFDERPVKVRVGENRVSCGTEHFGIIMAEHCRTGCNAVLLPGVKIGPNSIVGPGVILRSDLEPGKMALLSPDVYEVTDNPVDVSKVSREERMKMIKK